jgi:Zn-dependent peptidase ImmA (M78 family)/transcriptional regulator with XRE-family HTH domain
MEVNLNPEMLVLAREFREITQDELSVTSNIIRGKIAKLESGIAQASSEELDQLAKALDVPQTFLTQTEQCFGYGSSAYFYRKKAEVTAADRKRIHSAVNIVRIGLKQMLSQVEVESRKRLPKLDKDDYGGDARRVAHAVRDFWQLPDGPIANVTALLESAGIIVVPLDFGSRSMDATSIWLADMPPMVFINEQLPGDRWRFTLCHELAHLVMHDIATDQMEDEADAFASEFLMPEDEMRSEFSRISNIALKDLARLKAYWKTSMQALAMRAQDLGYLTQNQARYLWMTMSRLGYRSKTGNGEPGAIDREQPTNLRKLSRLFADNFGFSIEDVAALVRLTVKDFKRLFDASPWASVEDSPRPRLRLVAAG